MPPLVSFQFAYLIKIPKSTFWYEKIKRAHRIGKRYRIPISKRIPFWNGDASVKTSQDRFGIVSFTGVRE